jgi:hypothetical protein
VSQDLFDAALYTVWRGGLLCYTVDPSELGIPLDTSLLALMVDAEDQDAVNRVWPDEAQPLMIATRPTEPPYLRYAGQHDLMVEVQHMGLDFFALTQDRQARVMGMGLNADAGVDLEALGDGSLAIDVALDPAQLQPVVIYDELVAEVSDQIEANFAGLIADMLDPLLEGLIGDLAVGPFSMGGIGVTHLEIVPAGPTGGYMGAYLSAGVVDPTASCELGVVGCDEGGGGCGEGGCGQVAGCEEGCGEEGSCEEGSCELAPARRRARGIWLGNALLLLACLGVIAAHRLRARR